MCLLNDSEVYKKEKTLNKLEIIFKIDISIKNFSVPMPFSIVLILDFN